jgi:antitoxin ChpS
MLTVPRSILDMMRLEPGSTVRLAFDGERLIVESQKKPRYTLDELLLQYREGTDEMVQADEDRAWLDLKSVGREL